MKVVNYSNNQFYILTLYPTWFRWKGTCDYFVSMLNCLYIPHGSDESQCRFNFLPILVPLYPTWFRWKAIEIAAKKQAELLYIPHGSDERVQMKVDYECFIPFISHMVQMKVTPAILPAVLDFTLYPTWFRWKFLKIFILFTKKKLYIPHGSDERKIINAMDHMMRFTLYPTWFRWKKYRGLERFK